MSDLTKSPPQYRIPLEEDGVTSRVWYRFFETIAAGVSLPPTTVINLPTGVPVGTRGYVTDSQSTTFNALAVGGGMNKITVHYTGAAWLLG